MAGDAPTYADLRSVIETSRNFAVEGWSLTDKEADTAMDWVRFLEGINAPCPKIAGFDEGLQLVWPSDGARHYLVLSDDAEGFVLNFDSAALTRSQP